MTNPFEAALDKKRAALGKVAAVLDGVAGIRAAAVAAGPENDLDRARFLPGETFDAPRFGTNDKAGLDGFWFVPAPETGAPPVKFAPKKKAKGKKSKTFSAQLLAFLREHSTSLATPAGKLGVETNVGKSNEARLLKADFDEL